VLAEEALDEGFEVFSGFCERECAGGFGPVQFKACGLSRDPYLADGSVRCDDEFAGSVLEDDVHDAVVVFELEACVVVLGRDEGLLKGLEGFVGFAAEGGFVDHEDSLPGVLLTGSSTMSASAGVNGCAARGATGGYEVLPSGFAHAEALAAGEDYCTFPATLPGDLADEVHIDDD